MLDNIDNTFNLALMYLEGVENINYLQAAKRITGMIDKKLAN